MKLTKRKSFSFYRSYYDVFNELPDEDKINFIEALLNKQFLDIDPDTKKLSPMVKFAYISQMDSIEKQVKGYCDKTKEALNPDKSYPWQGVKNTPSVGVASTPSVQEKEKEKEKEKYTYLESDFLSNWKVLRKGYLNKPTNIDKLSTMERSDFNKAVSEFGKEKINIALKGLFKQEVINFGSMTLRPKHFFENVLKYYDAEMAKEYKLYGSKKKEIQY